MNILFVSALLPYPLYSGGQVRIYNLLKRLGKHHQITLVSFIRSQEERRLLGELAFCKRVETILRGRAWQPKYVLRAVCTSDSFLQATYNLQSARDCINTILQQEAIDLIHLEPGYVWSGVPETSIPTVVAEHNIEHTVYQGYVNTFPIPLLRQLLAKDVQKMAKKEKQIWNAARNVVVVSESDKAVIKNNSGVEASIVPNGVDLEYFTYHPKENSTSELRVLFVGSFRWIQNVDAVKRLLRTIWPAIARSFPMAQLTIVGKSFPDALRTQLPPGVQLDDTVEDIRNSYYNADVLLAPIEIGGGTKYKILEAMACGLPVITTAKGIEGMAVKDGTHLFLAKTPQAYCRIIETQILDSKKKEAVVASARTLVEQVYSWNRIAQALDAVWNDSV